MNMTRNGEPGALGDVVVVVEAGGSGTGTERGDVTAVTDGNAAAVVPVSTVLLAGPMGAARSTSP